MSIYTGTYGSDGIIIEDDEEPNYDADDER